MARKQVEETINKCDMCFKAKANRHVPYGLMKSPEIPTRGMGFDSLGFHNKATTIARAYDIRKVRYDIRYNGLTY